MINKKGNLVFGIILTFAVVFSILIPVTADTPVKYDFLVSDLRIDPTFVSDALGYQVFIQTIAVPITPIQDHFVAGWLSIDLAQNAQGKYPALFTQVGIRSDQRGTFWFVYTETGIDYCAGDKVGFDPDINKYLNCNGNIGGLKDIVTVGSGFSNKVGLRYSYGQWVASVSDNLGNSYDVATIMGSQTRIYDTTVSFEQAYPASLSDPHLTGRFAFSFPEFKSGSNYLPWPLSTFNNFSEIYPADQSGYNTFCPQYYGALVNIDGNPRSWFLGSGGYVCRYHLFPSLYLFLPNILK